MANTNNGATIEITEGQRNDEVLVSMVAGDKTLEAYIDAHDVRVLISKLQDALVEMKESDGCDRRMARIAKLERDLADLRAAAKANGAR